MAVPIIDRIIGWFDPQRAYMRGAWREQLDLQRGAYDAAGYDRLNGGWRIYNEAAEYTDRDSRDVIRARARDLERNSDMAGGLISAFKRNVIGSGYTLQANTGDKALDEKIEREWKNWCKKQHCDITGQQSLNQLLRMAIVRKKVDGGILFLKTYNGSGLIPLQLQTLEVDELSSSQTAPKHKGNKVIGGIELNAYNRPVGYWIEKYSLDGFALNEPQYVDASRVIFLWQKKRPSQIREVSDFAPTIPRIRDANELMTAVSVKERIAACLAVFIRKITPGGGGSNFGRSAQVSSDGTIQYKGKMLSPGMIQEMNPGEDVQVVDPKGSGGEAAGMLKIQQQLMASGQGVSYEAVSRDMSGVNYSSARQSTVEDGLTFAEDIELIRELLDEIYESFLISGYLAGVFDFPEFFINREKKHQYLTHQWVSSPKPWIDPIKEANANRIALENGIKTYQQIAAEQGRDWKEMLDEMIEVRDYCQEHKLHLGGDIYDYAGDQTAAGAGE